MKIAIDARMYNESGIGRYIRNLISNLEVLDEQNEYFILLSEKEYLAFNKDSNFKKVLANFRWYGIREQIQLPNLLNNIKPDLVHFPHFNVPINYSGKYVVTIHDLIHQHFKMKRATTHGALIYQIKQLGYNKVFKTSLQKSSKILVPSEYVKNLLIQEWGVDNGKILVTPEAVDDSLLSLIKNSSHKKIIEQPYIFYLGNAHPHKNIEGLIKVFLKLQERYPSLHLVLSGGDHYFWKKIKSGINSSSTNIIFTNYVTDEQIINLYKNAECFVLPSYEEGFGIPILEAMACSCPVVSSNAGSLPEVGGDAVIYFNPEDLSDMAEKIAQVLDDQKLRKNLIAKGLQRYKKFSWKKMAQQTLEVYQKCV